jgi:hypothetical protein
MQMIQVKRGAVGVLFVFCLMSQVEAQIPVSFDAPRLGYVFDTSTSSIRPILGIPGNATIGAPLDLGFSIAAAGMLPDQKYAIVSVRDSADLRTVDLAGLSASIRIAGVGPDVQIRPSADGAAAAVYDKSARRILVVEGLPGNPAVRESIDTSFVTHPIGTFAVTNDGAMVLITFSDPQLDLVYRWSRLDGFRLLTTAARVSDVAFLDGDAIFADSGAGQILRIRNLRSDAGPELIADARDGLAQPAAVAVSDRNEVYVADPGAGAVVVLDSQGRRLSVLPCACSPVTLAPLRDSVFRLTDRIDRPISLLDTRPAPPRILFIPALPLDQSAGSAAVPADSPSPP